LQGAEPFELRACLFELAAIKLAHARHRSRRRPAVGGGIELFCDRLDVSQGEAKVLELADPADAEERFVTVETEPPL
jgi:hypothetical protein